MTSACFSRANTGFSRNATLVAKVNPPALAGGAFNENFLPLVVLAVDLRFILGNVQSDGDAYFSHIPLLSVFEGFLFFSM